jgi:hypothetical protein
MSDLYNKNGITIKRFDARNYIVEGGNLPLSYHSTLDKAVLKVAKIEADKGVADASEDLWSWLAWYEVIAKDIARRLGGDLSHLTSEVCPDPSGWNKCLVDPTMDEDASLEAYNTRGDR